MTATLLHHLYAAVAVLNNTGVSLLERRCYRQAQETLKDGLAITKILSSLHAPQELPVDNDPNKVRQVGMPSWDSVQELLRRSNHRLFHLQPDVDANSHAQLNLQALTLEESDAVVVGATSQQEQGVGNDQEKANTTSSSAPSPACSTTYLIRIESSETEPHDHLSSNHMLDIGSSILLHNFGVSFKCLAVTTDVATISSREHAFELYKGASSLLELSYEISQRELSKGPSSQRVHCSGVGEFLPLAILCLGSLADFAWILGRENDAQIYTLHFNQAKATFMELQVKVCRKISAPAA